MSRWNDSMESGMLSHVQDMRALDPNDAKRICAKWREAAGGISCSRNFLTHVSQLAGPHNFLAGLCSVGFWHPQARISYHRLDDADSIYMDWLLTGQDLCDAMLRYTTTNPDGGTPRPNPTPSPKTSAKLLAMETSFAGPLPPPGILKGYEESCPGAAERIIHMAEAQGDHRRAIEVKMTDAAVEEMRRGFGEARVGQICALLISLAFLFVGAYVSIHGQPFVGGVLGTMGLSGIVANFIRGREKSSPPETSIPEPPTRKKR